MCIHTALSKYSTLNKVEPPTTLFAPSFADIPVRDQRDMMERPFFSLAKKPRKTPIAYEVGGTIVKIYSAR